MKTLTDYLSSYGRYHTKTSTRITHFVGVPLIIFSLMIFLGWFHLSVPPLFNLSFAWLALIAVSIFYARLDLKIGLSLFMILAIMTFISQLFSQPGIHETGAITFVICFILGWAIQFLGHAFEGKQPAFLSNIEQIFIAPLYLAAEVACHFNLRKDLQKALHDSEF